MAPMTMTSLQFRTRVRLTLLTSAVVAAVTFTGAQQPAIPAAVLAASLDQTVPVDSADYGRYAPERVPLLHP